MCSHPQPAAENIASGTRLCRAGASTFTLGSQLISSSQMSAGISHKCDPHCSPCCSCLHPCFLVWRCLSGLQCCILFLCFPHLCGTLIWSKCLMVFEVYLSLALVVWFGFLRNMSLTLMLWLSCSSSRYLELLWYDEEELWKQNGLSFISASFL